ncbi:hypothetical protein [Hymenobacter canadensis]|uniref:Uncharacterized protein n=1 Tax=Hymenobacter canadensis TaxID=2999067 RepID=A0ABY7LRE9_9BACT|nr:hypothetical protein [Hymenobacter canadensis]WBA42993.1 hypothetical protein O3303_05365 [Hymenobacter canadensis]
MKFLVFLIGLALLGATACQPPEEEPILLNPTHQAVVAEVYYAIQSAYELSSPDTMRFALRHRFISRHDPRRTLEDAHSFLEGNHIDVPADWPLVITPAAPAVAPPYAITIGQDLLRVVVLTHGDTVRSNINQFLTVSTPIPLPAGQQLVYYEMGHKRNMMSAGFMLLVVEPTGKRRLIAERGTWNN